MFDDQNQNSSTAAPAVDPPQTDTPSGDASVAAPSAPTLTDPMVTPTTVVPEAPESPKVEAGINGVSMENAYIDPGPQIGPAKTSEPESVPTAASMIPTPSSPAAPIDNDLSQIKQQALQSLEPLVDKLDQVPEEKFKTIMMLIQASDNSKMLQAAYDAASKISDEKTRAQALLDVVNEINYFTQQAQAKTGNS